MEWWAILVAAVAVAVLVQVVKAWLWLAQWPSARVRDVGLRTLAVLLGAIVGLVRGDVVAGLAAGGLSMPAFHAARAALRRWGQTAPVPWSIGAEPDPESGHGHGEPAEGEQ